MPNWIDIPILLKLFLISLVLGVINYLILRRKGYTSITYLILGIGAIFMILYQLFKLI